MGKKNRRAKKHSAERIKRQAKKMTLFCDEPGRRTTGAFLRSERYRRINAERDDLSVMPDDEGNIVISKPENPATFEELKQRDEAELAKLGLEPGYWRH